MIKTLTLLGAAIAAMAVGVAKDTSESEKHNLLKADTEIIVSLQQDPYTYSEEYLVTKQNELVSQIKTLTHSEVKVMDRYTKSISALHLKVNASTINQIRHLNNVSKIDYNKLHRASYSTDGAASTIKGLPSIDADKVNNSAETMNLPAENNGGEGTLVAILDTGFMLDGSYTLDGVTYEHQTHEIYTELEEGTTLKIESAAALHSLVDGDPNFHGKYDSTHSTYFNNKVPFYFDYGGDLHSIAEYNSGANPDDDFDVTAQSEPHGNHVASIAAGNAPHYKGIAPKAQLALMKVFVVAEPTEEEKEQGYTSVCGAFDADIISALEDCITLGVDVLNMSLGSTLDDFDQDSVACKAVKNCEKAGIFCAIAAGNDGRDTFDGSAYEFWSTEIVESGILSSYSNIEDSFTVAAAQPTKQYFEKALKIGEFTIEYFDQIANIEGSDISYSKEHFLTDLIESHPDGHIGWERIGGWGEEKDYEGLDVNGKIAIIDRGETTFLSKISIAEAHGAVAVGIIDNDATATEFNFRMDLSGYTPKLPVISILFRDKVKINSVTSRDAELIIAREESNPLARTMADFSSNGCTFDLRIKPEISAPGLSILGAVTDSKTAYEYYDGTSMATPNIAGAIALIYGEHLSDASWKQSIYARIMSTANIMNDATNDPHFDSVRRQGAGMIDIGGAINTNAYLLGSAKGVKNTKKAKIELGNTADISKGKVNLNFSIVNTSSKNINYTATTYIMRPELKELDPEVYPELANTKLQATYDHLIGTVVNNVTAEANKTTDIALPTYEIPTDEIETLNKYFEVGAYIEGFVILEANGEETLNIPFLGFYGDYSKAIPVEPFVFEKDENKVYQSDITYDLVDSWAGKHTADFTSDAVLGYWKDLSKLSVENYLLNDTPLRELTSSTSTGTPSKVIPCGYDSFTGEKLSDPTVIYANNKTTSNTLIMSQFVNRSVKTNTVTFTNKATEEIVLVDHMYSALRGPIEENGVEVQWPLYKSQIDTNFWANSIYIDRAYSLFPLYESEYNKEKDKYIVGDAWAEGEYEIKMEYILTDDSVYTKTYTLVIDNSMPMPTSKEMINGKTMRIRFGSSIPSSMIQYETKFAISKDDQGYYCDLDISNAQNNKLWFVNTNIVNDSVPTITHTNDPFSIFLGNSGLKKNSDFETEITTEVIDGVTTKTFNLTLKNATAKGDFGITFDASSFASNEFKIEVKNSAGKFVDAAYELNNNYVSFQTNKLTFRISGVYTEPVKPAKGGCSGSIASASVLVSCFSLALAACLIIRKRKFEN